MGGGGVGIGVGRIGGRWGKQKCKIRRMSHHRINIVLFNLYFQGKGSLVNKF